MNENNYIPGQTNFSTDKSNTTDKNKYVLVTGAYGGMGNSTVKTLVKNGYTVFALDKTIKALDKTTEIADDPNKTAEKTDTPTYNATRRKNQNHTDRDGRNRRTKRA